MKFADIRSRAATATVLVVVILLAVVGGPLPLLMLTLAINSLAISEYNRLARLMGYFPQAASMQAAGLLLITMVWSVSLGYFPPVMLVLFLPAPAIVCSAELWRRGQQPFVNIALTLLAPLWISVPLAAFSAMGAMVLPADAARLYAGYFLLLWAGDSGAYFTGSLLGRHPLLSRISPKKTIEGSAGGLIAVIITSILNAAFFNVLALQDWLLIGLLVNVSGTLGDLVKSMLKRSAGVKDSGNLLPGHGGIIDRFDSLLGSAPVLYLYLHFYA